MKFYPPQIEGTLPAIGVDNISAPKMVIPFSMNKTVSVNTVSGFAIQIKNMQNNEIIYTGTTEFFDLDIMEAYFLDPNLFNKLTIGQFYKVQLAYIDNIENEIGYFSTVGVIKYTTKPKVTIVGMTEGKLHPDQSSYMGSYSQQGQDTSEKIYSYQFEITDRNHNFITGTEKRVHNHEKDANVYESFDEYILNYELQTNQIYYIQYKCITVNNMIINSPRYRIVQRTTIPPEIDITITAVMNEDNGYVDLNLMGGIDKETQMEQRGVGSFLIARANSKNNFSNWENIAYFSLYGTPPSEMVIKDFTVEHGIEYKYALQQYNEITNIYSNRIESNYITANFEDSFLFDGKRQLKIKYNPKVASFKTSLLESKLTTLGGQYPYIFRNGTVNYKEFSISGLISYLSDEEELFATNEELGLVDYKNLKREYTLNPNISSQDYNYFNNMEQASIAQKLQMLYKKRESLGSNEKLIASQRLRSTNLENYNIAAERLFKLKVLEFLNNGEPKLFRSPAEGNYFVRLMNSNLTPNDQLGRMLHTFTSNACEIGDCNHEILSQYKMSGYNLTEDIEQIRWETKTLTPLQNMLISDSEMVKINQHQALSIQCIDMLPSEKIYIKMEADEEPITIVIGVTGAYFATFDKPIYGIYVSPRTTQGQITYSYYGTQFNQFDTYQSIDMDDIPITQIIGQKLGKDGLPIDIKSQLEDIKHKITEFTLLHFVKRTVIDIYYYAGRYYYTPKYYDELNDSPTDNQILQDEVDFDPLCVYRVVNSDYYLDGETKTMINDYNNKVELDGQVVDLTDTEEYFVTIPDTITTIYQGSGIVSDIGAQRRVINYQVEETDQTVVTTKNNWQAAYNSLRLLITGDPTNESSYEIDTNTYLNELKTARENEKQKYDTFIHTLKTTLIALGVEVDTK